MSYIGVQPTAGQYRKLDDISGSFNGSTTTFTTQVGSQNVSAGTAQQLLVSLGGVIQNPITDYTVSTNSITFTTAPAAGLSFFAVLMGEAVNTGTPSDGVVTGAKLSAPFNYNSGLLYLDSSNNRVGIGTTSAGGKLHVSSGSSSALVSADADELIVENSGNSGITIATPNSGTGSIRFADPQNNDSGSISYNHNDETLRFATFSTERARFDSSGRLLVGTSSAPTGTNSQYSKHVIQGNTFDGSGSARMAMRVGVGASSLSSGSGIADIYFVDSGAGEYARIGCEADAQAGTNDYPGRLVFSTTADGASSPTERLRIASDGSISSVIPGGSTLYPRFGCRAWVNFDGTTASPSTRRGNGNVSSVTKNGTGDYTVNFTTAMPDANYSVVATNIGSVNVNQRSFAASSNNALATGSCRMVLVQDNGALNDQDTVSVAIFR